MRNISNTFCPGTANKYIVQWWFRKFCKADERLEDEEYSGWPSEVGNDQLRNDWSSSSYNYMTAVLCLVAHLCPTLCDSPPGSSVHGGSPGKNTGVGCHALLQIFPTQGWNSGLLHCRWILHHLRNQGSPTTWEKLPKNSLSTILCSFSILSKLERWKKLSKWVPHKLTTKKKSSFWSVISLILCYKNEPFLY